MTLKAQSDSSLPELPREYYWRRLNCPLTGAEFPVVMVKRNAYSLRGRDPDFAPRYDGINPLWYGAVVSPNGFAADEAVYKRSPKLLFRDHDALIAHIRNQPEQYDFSGLRNLPLACQAYTMALGQTSFLRLPRFEVAGLALRASWLYRELYEDGYEPALAQVEALRKIALQHYLLAYEKEDTSRLKLGSSGVAYLIAELLREQGQYDDSLRWFGRVVHDKAAAGEVLRQARDRMELCREQRAKAREAGEYERPEAERYKERAMYQLYRDQVRWLTKAAGGGSLGESGILRGVMDGLRKSGLELNRFDTEEELADHVARKLGLPTGFGPTDGTGSGG